MVYAFLDTNILLHYKVFEGMPWNTILGDEEFTFVICQKVFDEIDKYKDGDKAKLRNRAKAINKYLISYLDNNPKSKLNITFCPNPSKISTERNDFDVSSSDEYIVFSAYEFDTKNCRKVIITGDGGMKLRAMKLGIETILLTSSDYLLPQEPTIEEKKIKLLEKELARYTARCSKPILLFENGDDTVTFHRHNIPDNTKCVEEYRKHLEAQYPHYIFPQKSAELTELQLASFNIGLSLYTEDDYLAYNKQIDEFIDNMVLLKQSKLRHSAIDSCIKEIKLSIFNKGTAPTGNMGILIKLPKDLVILSEDALVGYDMTPPTEPKLLSKYDRNARDMYKIIQQTNAALTPCHYVPSNSNDYKTEKHWNIKSEMPKEIFIELPSLNHNLNCVLGNSHRLFLPCIKSGKYQILWTISDESNINPITGELIINIK